MTDEQKANVDKALGKANISKEISGASDVQGAPTPNEPQSVDKTHEIGQDLHKQGVTLDKG